MGPSIPEPSTAEGQPLTHRSGPRLFARNRRDGARLLSSTLVIAVIGAVAWQHVAGRVVAVVAASLSLFWWLQYRQLKQ
jgi:hypothetical protein